MIWVCICTHTGDLVHRCRPIHRPPVADVENPVPSDCSRPEFPAIIKCLVRHCGKTRVWSLHWARVASSAVPLSPWHVPCSTRRYVCSVPCLEMSSTKHMHLLCKGSFLHFDTNLLLPWTSCRRGH